MKKENIKKVTIYKLISENLTGLGGPMGSEWITDNWIKYFLHKKDAKKIRK